jgi:hypothetical protein
MKTKLKDFVILPRSIRDDYLTGKITQNELNVLIWIWFNTNPYNGFHILNYPGLQQDLRNSISYVNARKIISSLRVKHYIYFVDHKGRKGSFPVYPIGFLLSNEEIQTEDYIKNRPSITTQPQCKEPVNDKPENSFDTPNHNFEEQRMGLIRHASMDSRDRQITTPNNDNETKTYKKTINDIKKFSPNSYEEERCLQIAKSLGEQDMAFILSCLKKYGLREIERVWGIIKEDQGRTIRNPARYFNKVISELNKNNNH